jgi:hypothetical protein
MLLRVKINTRILDTPCIIQMLVDLFNNNNNNKIKINI